MGDAGGVLGGDRGEGGSAEDPQGGEGLQVGLDAGPAAAVGPGNGQVAFVGVHCAIYSQLDLDKLEQSFPRGLFKKGPRIQGLEGPRVFCREPLSTFVVAAYF